MRKEIIAGNWKMNKDVDESVQFIEQLKKSFSNKNKVEVVVCPPFIGLSEAGKMLKETSIQLGAQNMHYEDKGAYTGEISPYMLRSAGCRYVIIGHSERREYFKESNEFLNLKVKAAIKNYLIPIFCVGETLTEREAKKEQAVVKKQLQEGLVGLTTDELKKIVIAYEPVWAIGTGKTASPQQANDMHAYIRKVLKEVGNAAVADKISILYGGSVKPDNVTELMNMPDIDGALVGGASLKPDSFLELVNY